MQAIAVGKFKQTCLRLLEEVRQTGKPLLITKRGKPIAQVGPPPRSLSSSWRGAMRGTGKIHGDIVAPASDPADWDAIQD
ncbi:MAG: type II toxin-antitoxin system Phd/YefM family antitoxin [Candidatus Binatia bacterium]